MQILNWIPAHAEQIRYVAPQYDEDNEGRYCINEDECTSVWYDIIREVNRTKRPMYYRRRTVDLARRDRHMYQDQVNNENHWKENNEQLINVRVKVVGRRVVFIYDEEFVRKNWLARKRKVELQDKIRKLKEGKFKGYVDKILKSKEKQMDSSELFDLIDANEWGSDEREE
jgi:hypothetical protein|tara:strand:+ start:109 stop:621 length:513 start_codon:yes stop_codon:yes gene_type:complete